MTCTFRLRTFGIAVWLAAILGGLLLLARYDADSGAVPEAAARWPASSRLLRAPGAYTLIMAAHPRCPCTRASLRELERALARATRPVTAYILFAHYAGTAEDWAQSDLWRYALGMRGVQAIEDEDAHEARLFGGTLSGTTLLYDSDGSLRFSGGVTGARGHEGDNPGRSRLTALLAGESSPLDRLRVFGCALMTGPG